MNTKNEMTTSEDTSALPVSYMDANASLAVTLARAEIDQQIATARALPRSIERAIKNIVTLSTLDEETAAECIYALPRGGKTIRGPSIRFAEIVASQWGNARVGSRVAPPARLRRGRNYGGGILAKRHPAFRKIAGDCDLIRTWTRGAEPIAGRGVKRPNRRGCGVAKLGSCV